MDSTSNKTLGGRVAIVGMGSRAATYVRGVVERPASTVVAFCEPNSVRAAYYNELLESLGAKTVPVYKPDEFQKMLTQEQVEVVVVTCIDAMHDEYIVPALEAGLRVLTEKPMTTNIEKCRRILDAVQRTGRHVTVTFNYRYNPVHELVKRMIAEGQIGEVHFEWLLDTVHGADFFRRWHRQKENSGGLLVHKAGHHFDLVNWWLDAEPETVVGMGRLAFYGEEAGKKHGWARNYERVRGNAVAKDDPFGINLEGDPTLKRIYADAEIEDGYHRDQNVFAPGIGIEDDMSVMVRYNTGATMTYHLTAYSPWEGYRVMFNGSKGRIELEIVESQYRLATTEDGWDGLIHGTQGFPNEGGAKVTLNKLWQKPENIPVEIHHAGHGGGDSRMLNALFGPVVGGEPETGDASKRGANERDGAIALAVGLMANESFKTGQLINLKSMGLQV